MKEDKSELLHMLRWISALLVVISHAQIIVPTNDLVILVLSSQGHAAVMVFFVLSGYVIAATSDKRKQQGYSFEQYTIDRFARIYSVLAPAILLTLILDLLGVFFYPARYSNPDLLPQAHLLFRFVLNSLCLQGIWGYRIQLGSNPPLWSIGYEFFYYIIFGLCFWKPKHWMRAIAIGTLLVGPIVVAYGLIWAFGLFAYRLNKAGYHLNSLPTAVLLFASNYMFQYQSIIHLPQIVGDVAFGLSVMLFVMSSAQMPKRFYSSNRFMAEFSYSLYAYHYPIIFFAASSLQSSTTAVWGLVALALITSWVLHLCTEAKRGLLGDATLKAISLVRRG